jgi:hypothetical protein
MPYALCPVVPHLSEKGYIFPVSDSILNYVSHNISSRHDTGQTSIA